MKQKKGKNKMEYSNLENMKDNTPFNIIGVEKADLGEIQEAIRYFTEAIELNPNDPRAYFNRATLRVKIGDIMGARSDFNLVMKLS
jgi:Flp pilus assembly protein TadD